MPPSAATSATSRSSSPTPARASRPAFLPHVFERFRQADARAHPHARRPRPRPRRSSRHLVELHGGTITVTARARATARPSPCACRSARWPRSIATPRATTAPRSRRACAARPSSRACTCSSSTTSPTRRELLARRARALRRAVSPLAARRTGGPPAAARAPPGRADLRHRHARRGRPRADPARSARSRRRPAATSPALALTAYARMEDRTRALLAGFQMHVPKPLDPTELVVVLANIADWSDDSVWRDRRGCSAGDASAGRRVRGAGESFGWSPPSASPCQAHSPAPLTRPPARLRRETSVGRPGLAGISVVRGRRQRPVVGLRPRPDAACAYAVVSLPTFCAGLLEFSGARRDARRCPRGHATAETMPA